MSRIRKMYEGRFRALLVRVNARRVEQGIQWRFARAGRISAEERISPTQGLVRVCETLRARLELKAGAQTGDAAPAQSASQSAPTFLCDAGLGGLARWLRAAGYEAIWHERIEDDELLREAQRLRATLLTTDGLLMERRLLRDGVVPSVWLPSSLTMEEQLVLVFRELRLPLRPPRCMSCGGELRRVEKEAMRDRIPPKTWRWRDEYFVCTRCDRLFWHGTHWQKIQARLREAAEKGAGLEPFASVGSSCS
ncbi:MAG: Mut7-C RNAse domain-containing protein [Verrucomicrobia bacterium]|nr:Mut7-C RNAse domain-containing protein [Verrucomicrobiota bacterium]